MSVFSDVPPVVLQHHLLPFLDFADLMSLGRTSLYFYRCTMLQSFQEQYVMQRGSHMLRDLRFNYTHYEQCDVLNWLSIYLRTIPRENYSLLITGGELSYMFAHDGQLELLRVITRHGFFGQWNLATSALHQNHLAVAQYLEQLDSRYRILATHTLFRIAHTAVGHGYLQVLRYIFPRLSINHSDQLFEYAAQNGQIAAFSLLLELYNVPVTGVLRKCYLAAAANQQTEFVEYLLNTYEVNCAEYFAHSAISRGHISTLERLLKNGLVSNAIKQQYLQQRRLPRGVRKLLKR